MIAVFRKLSKTRSKLAPVFSANGTESIIQTISAAINAAVDRSTDATRRSALASRTYKVIGQQSGDGGEVQRLEPAEQLMDPSDRGHDVRRDAEEQGIPRLSVRCPQRRVSRRHDAACAAAVHAHRSLHAWNIRTAHSAAPVWRRPVCRSFQARRTGAGSSRPPSASPCGRQELIRPGAQRPAQPVVDGHGEAHLRPLDHLARQVAVQHLAQDPLADPVAQLQRRGAAATRTPTTR